MRIQQIAEIADVLLSLDVGHPNPTSQLRGFVSSCSSWRSCEGPSAGWGEEVVEWVPFKREVFCMGAVWVGVGALRNQLTYLIYHVYCISS